MRLLERVANMLNPPARAQEPEPAGDDPDAIELTLEQRVARMEVEVGDLWEHLRRWSARQAARARRDIQAMENGAVSEEVPTPAVTGAPTKLVPGSKAWRDHQKMLIRQGAS